MGMKFTTPMSAIDQIFASSSTRIKAGAIRKMNYAGEACVAEARKKGSYKDRTGNLRSSIGYVVVSDGKVVEESTFPASKVGTDKVTGQVKGREYAEELARDIDRNDTALIVVAGMDYAKHVASKGKNVLDSAEIRLKKIFSK